MSDMPAPRPAPPLVDHAQHDPLLIAQHAAGDPLDAAQHEEAARLVAGCHDCAVLAADLRAVSAAVAWEPVPPRRRDFRIDAGRAEQLRGSALQRFLRRLALPETRVLRPVAAGVMSVGLLFVVAGTAWPDSQAVPGSDPVLQSEALLAPSGPLASPPAAALQMEAPAAVSPAAAPAGDVSGSDTSAADEVNAAAEMQAFSSEDVGSVTEQADDGAVRDASGSDASAAAGAADAADAAEAPVDTSLRSKALPDVPASSPAADAAADAAVGAALPPEATPGEVPLAAVAAEVVPADDVSRPEESALAAGEAKRLPAGAALVVLGVVLAAGGALLLLLTWLSRRARDPLLR
jgi:hypothetical protein